MDILKRCQDKGVPVSPIRNLEELFNDPITKDLILEEELSDGRISKRVKTVVFKGDGD